MRTTRDRLKIKFPTFLKNRKMLTTRNSKTLSSFVEYCESQPDLRFWQALRLWAGYQFIYASDNGWNLKDTYSWEGRRHGEQSEPSS